MIGDKVQAQYYGRRSDGIDLYRYAVPNVRISPKPIGESIAEDEEKYWEKPKYKILQHPTEQNYDCAVDVESAGFTYTETDISIDGVEEPPSDLTVTESLNKGQLKKLLKNQKVKEAFDFFGVDYDK